MDLKAVKILTLYKYLHKCYIDDAIYGLCYESLDCDGKLHAELNKPARVAINGTLYVFSDHGTLHRTDGPAVIRFLRDSNELRLAWYMNGKLTKTEYIGFDPNRVDLYKD